MNKSEGRSLNEAEGRSLSEVEGSEAEGRSLSEVEGSEAERGSVSEAERWVDARLGEAPAELLDAMRGAIRPGDGTVPDALARAAMDLYAQVANGSGGREAALPLLAADALLTHAFEAQAEIDPAGVAGLAARWGAAGALGRLP